MISENIISPSTKSANSTNASVPSSGTIGGSETSEPTHNSEIPSSSLPTEEVDISAVDEYVTGGNIISYSIPVRTGDDSNNSFYMMLLLSSTIMLLLLFLGKCTPKRKAHK